MSRSSSIGQPLATLLPFRIYLGRSSNLDWIIPNFNLEVASMIDPKIIMPWNVRMQNELQHRPANAVE